MTPKERVLERIAGNKVDKIPNMTLTSKFSAKYINIEYGTFCSDYKALVAAQSKTAKDFGIDILSTLSDPYRETHDYGAPLSFFRDESFKSETPFFNRLEHIHQLKPFNPFKSKRCLDSLKAIKLFKEIFTDHYPILGWIEGPLSQFCNLMSVNIGLSMLNKEQEIKKVLTLLTDQSIQFALSQINSGADIIGIRENIVSLLGANGYKNLILEHHTKIIKAIKDAGALSKLHIEGNISHIFESVLLTKSNIIDVDHCIELRKAIKLSTPHCSLCGNVASSSIILRGYPKEIKRHVDYCIKKSNKYFIVSSSSEIHPQTPVENFLAINERLVEIGAN